MNFLTKIVSNEFVLLYLELKVQHSDTTNRSSVLQYNFNRDTLDRDTFDSIKILLSWKIPYLCSNIIVATNRTSHLIGHFG